MSWLILHSMGLAGMAYKYHMISTYQEKKHTASNQERKKKIKKEKNLLESQREMEASAATPTTITSPTLLNNDTTTQEYEQEEVPLEIRTPLVDEEAAPLNDDDDDGTTTQEYEQSRTPPLVDGVVVHATMAKSTILPKYVIIQSNVNHSYLRYNGKNPDIPNALHFNGDYSFGLETRFEVVLATTGAELVHIRCLRNNKYLRVHYNTDNIVEWISARADKPEEDQTKIDCTLFRPVFLRFSNNNPVCLLQHVSTRWYLRRFNGTNNYEGVLTVGVQDEFTFIDWESVVVLPDRIRIEGDNGNYLCAYGGDGFMDYNLKPDNSGYFDFDVSPSRDGGVRLKSVFYNEWYWTDMDDSVWVLLKKPPSTAVHNINTVFLPQMRGGNRIVMRSLRSNMFCKRFTGNGRTNCLATNTPFVDPPSNMTIEEAVYSRTINNVRYHLADASITIDGTPELKTDNTNNRTQSPVTAELDIRRTFTNTTRWSSNLAWKLGVKMTVQFGVLDVYSSGIEISAEVTKEYKWEDTETETINLGSLRTVTVPAMSRVEMSLIGTRVLYRVPFSYTQRDVLKNGTVKVYHKNDGVLTGTNGYDYKQKIVQLPPPPR